jgi:hypothetical protein
LIYPKLQRALLKLSESKQRFLKCVSKSLTKDSFNPAALNEAAFRKRMGLAPEGVVKTATTESNTPKHKPSSSANHAGTTDIQMASDLGSSHSLLIDNPVKETANHPVVESEAAQANTQRRKKAWRYPGLSEAEGSKGKQIALPPVAVEYDDEWSDAQEKKIRRPAFLLESEIDWSDNKGKKVVRRQYPFDFYAKIDPEIEAQIEAEFYDSEDDDFDLHIALEGKENGLYIDIEDDLMGLSFEQSPPLPARGLNRLEQYGIRLVQAFSEA